MFSQLHFADSISHFIRCPFSHFRIFALRILYVPLWIGLGLTRIPAGIVETMIWLTTGISSSLGLAFACSCCNKVAYYVSLYTARYSTGLPVNSSSELTLNLPSLLKFWLPYFSHECDETQQTVQKIFNKVLASSHTESSVGRQLKLRWRYRYSQITSQVYRYSMHRDTDTGNVLCNINVGHLTYFISLLLVTAMILDIK